MTAKIEKENGVYVIKIYNHGQLQDAIAVENIIVSESAHKDISAHIKSLRLSVQGEDDPFFLYQQGKISKAILIKIIIGEIDECLCPETKFESVNS